MSLPVHEYAMCLHLFTSSLDFFQRFFSFQHTDFVHVLLDLYLSVSLFGSSCKWYYILKFLFPVVDCYITDIEFCELT